jgi:hypothetical protein
VAPVFLRRRSDDFEPGPWNLGRFSAPVGWIAIGWVAVICVLFVLPTAGPVTALNFNYTIVAVLVVVGGATAWWFLGARKWFTGPRQNVLEKAAAGEPTLPVDGNP